MDSFRSSVNPNKQLKEEFVSNLTGSSMLEIAALMTIVPILVVLRHSINFDGNTDPLHIMKGSSKKDVKEIIGCKNWRVYMIALVTDFLFVVLPMLLFFTVLADWTEIAAVCFVLLVLIRFTIKGFDSSSSYSRGWRETVVSVRTILSSYRVSMMIMTCLCILAVDFRIFPRRYGKTETYGTSLMDLGVGSFVLANALVSRQARNIPVKWKSMLQSASPLMFLGVGRLIFTASFDYQVHVGEYGVHWNFFFTLAAISILTSIIQINPQYCGIVGLLILIGHQTCLLYGLSDYLLSIERTTNIIDQNKEGIFSLFGYWGMYLVGVHFGNYLFFGYNSTSRTVSNQQNLIKIFMLATLSWLSTVILDKYVERASRRMCNMAYVSFVLAQNFQAIAVGMFANILGEKKTSVLEEAFNRNLLGIFLLANIFTGLINMYVDTIYMSSVAALGILIAYAFALCVLAGFAELSGIKFRFW